MITIRLTNLEFNAYHGLHPEETMLGATFRVNCVLTFPVFNEVVESINQTVDYVQLYELIKDRMSRPTPLLETVIMEMGIAIESKFPEVKSISLTIEKLNPPISGFRGNVAVEWNKSF